MSKTPENESSFADFLFILPVTARSVRKSESRSENDARKNLF